MVVGEIVKNVCKLLRINKKTTMPFAGLTVPDGRIQIMLKLTGHSGGFGSKLGKQARSDEEFAEAIHYRPDCADFAPAIRFDNEPLFQLKNGYGEVPNLQPLNSN